MTIDPSSGSGALRIWRDDDLERFDATVLVAAGQLDVQPLAVEKDYWVCRTLRALEDSHSGAFIFKGGTSLEKLRLIERLSEDLDILVVSDFPTVGKAKEAMKLMCSNAALAIGSTVSSERGGGSKGSVWRRAYVAPPFIQSVVADSALASQSEIQIELGQSGGSHPSSRRTIESLLARQMASSGQSVTEFLDLAPFETMILHPGRTLLEKLLRVNDFAVRQEESEFGWPRIGRQFYDIWGLLGSEEVLDFLTNRAAVEEILRDCLRVSAMYTPAEDLPVGGFASSIAFDIVGPMATRLREQHQVAMRDLYYGSLPPPTFDETLRRIQEHRDLLVLEI
jgi:hypothetical protein